LNPSTKTVHSPSAIGNAAGALLSIIIAFLLWTRLANGFALALIALFGLIFAAVNAFNGIRASRSVWTAAHLGLLGMSILYWLPASYQHPFAVWLLYWPLLFILGEVALHMWTSEASFWAALSLFPCSLYLIRLWMVDILAWNLMWSLIMTFAALAVFIITISLITLRAQYRWWILGTAAILYFGMTLIANAATINPQTQLRYLPLLAILASSPFLAGGQVYRQRFGKREWTWGLAACVIGLIFIPWYGANLMHPKSPASADRRPVIIDTDMSHDDIVAILYLLQRTDLDIRAITIANGVAHVGNGGENMRRLLTLAGQDSIPVAPGQAAPLNGTNSFTSSLRYTIDYVFRPSLPLATRPGSSISAPDLIKQQLESSSEPVLVIALGPLTNLALALRENPNLISHIDKVVISGGAIHVPGVVHVEDPSIPNIVSEWNLFVDPLAASEVFDSGARLELVPMDVTNNTGSHPILIGRSFIGKFAASAQTRSTRLMADIMQEWLDSSELKADAIPLWDAPVAAIATNSDICSDWQEMAIEIQSGDISVDGQTLVTDDKPNTLVCMGGDQAAFDAAYLSAEK